MTRDEIDTLIERIADWHKGNPVGYGAVLLAEASDALRALRAAPTPLAALPTPSALTDALAWLDQKIAEGEARFAAGKGTWPEQDYVRDETWARWHGEHNAFQRCRVLLWDAAAALAAPVGETEMLPWKCPHCDRHYTRPAAPVGETPAGSDQ